ncbi:hypothetical protein PAUR_b0158 [Pseudoalteromonas aurantia 208]|uniref:Uncharacterized protein n=1 Tax=Pseudoalteromonas aurantia 208 TaxID=1314867 RepID=A0ABR9EGR1_9GAMM|nr:hypothetical protein [Pseudoalteromonas aurantia 208]
MSQNDVIFSSGSVFSGLFVIFIEDSKNMIQSWIYEEGP